MRLLRAIIRKFYYSLNNGRVTTIKAYEHLKGSKWIVDSRFGMAYFKGHYEPRICSFLLKVIYEDSVFIDVGAHAGYFSLFAVKLSQKGLVYSFEPEPNNYNYINRIKSLHGLENWKIFNKGVGRDKCTLNFCKGPSSTTGKVAETGDFKIDIVSIDELFANCPKVDMVKIDEGFGGRVLQGAINTIERHRPKILFEVHKQSDELAVLRDILKDWYILKDLDTGKLILLGDTPHYIVAEPKLN